MNYFLIAIGGAIGSVARYLCSAWIAGRAESQLPWGTIVVNVIGSLVIGAIAGALEPSSRLALSLAARENINYFWMVGVLGGFTTFSSFSLQTLMLMRTQQWGLAGANVLLSVLVCLVAVWFGFWLASTLTR
jgi:CrcB protein